MKKILLFITMAALATSCSDDLNSGNPGGGSDSYVLVKKQVETAADGSSITTNYSYDANKLTSVTHSNGTNEAYTYFENYITEIRHYENGGLIEKEVFTYSTSGLTGYVSYLYDLANPANNNAVKYEYIYNGGTITVNKYTGDQSSQTVAAGTVTLTVTSNGNITQYHSGTTTIDYNFDLNSSPVREIAGYQAVVLAALEGGANNITTKRVNNNGTIANSLNTYVYNPVNYPVTANHTGADGSISTSVYTY
jgi:YD repeat-containing protein